LSFIDREATVKNNDSSRAAKLATLTKTSLSFNCKVWIDLVWRLSILRVNVNVSATASG